MACLRSANTFIWISLLALGCDSSSSTVRLRLSGLARTDAVTVSRSLHDCDWSADEPVHADSHGDVVLTVANESVLSSFLITTSSGGRGTATVMTNPHTEVSATVELVSAGAELSWRAGPAIRHPRIGATAAAIGQTIYLFGGDGESTVELLDTSNATPMWTESSFNVPGVFTAESIGTSIVLLGNAPIEFSTAGPAEAPAGLSFSARSEFAAASVGTRVFWAGGKSSDATLGDFVGFDSASGAIAGLPALPDRRSQMAMAIDAQRGVVYFAGGDAGPLFATYSLAPPGTAIGRSDAAGDPGGTSRLHPAALVGGDGALYLIGGRDGENISARATRYDPLTAIFSDIPDLPATLDRFAALIGPDGPIYLIGGTEDGQSAESTVWSYGPHFAAHPNGSGDLVVEGEGFIASRRICIAVVAESFQIAATSNAHGQLSAVLGVVPQGTISATDDESRFSAVLKDHQH